MAMEIYILILGTSALSFMGTMIQKRMLDMDLVHSLKADIKKLNNEAKAAKNDVKQLTKITSKQLNVQKQLMSHTMKPAMVSSLPILAALMLFGGYFKDIVVYLPFALPWIGSTLGWFGVYIVVALVSTMIFRKLLGLDVMG